MCTIKCKKKLSSNCREKIRDEVTDWFLQEKPGKGNGDLTSRAVYEVEEYGDLVIELHRPAALNKGFDFTVQIKGLLFKNKKHKSYPSHNDILAILDSFGVPTLLLPLQDTIQKQTEVSFNDAKNYKDIKMYR